MPIKTEGDASRFTCDVCGITGFCEHWSPARLDDWAEKNGWKQFFNVNRQSDDVVCPACMEKASVKKDHWASHYNEKPSK